jgi:hypothetical protein
VASDGFAVKCQNRVVSVVCTVIEPPLPSRHATFLRRPPEQALVCTHNVWFNFTANRCEMREGQMSRYSTVGQL